MGLDVLGTFSVGQQSFMVGGVLVQPGSELDGLRIRELPIRIRVIAVKPDGSTADVYPRRDTLFQAGDTAYLVGPYHDLLTILRKGQRGHPPKALPPAGVAEGLGLSDGLS
jgi:Trk K+ transport system NAD-binding subunit